MVTNVIEVRTTYLRICVRTHVRTLIIILCTVICLQERKTGKQNTSGELAIGVTHTTHYIIEAEPAIIALLTMHPPELIGVRLWFFNVLLIINVWPINDKI